MNHREGFVCALLVGEYHQDAKVISEVFGHCGWHLCQVDTRAAAIEYARRNRVHVVIAPSVGWQQLLEALEQIPDAPQLIVTSRTADEYLWAAVLNHGGFDVLPQPFDRDELQRVIAAAGRRAFPQPLHAAAAQVA